MSEYEEKIKRRLKSIADILGTPVDSFLDGEKDPMDDIEAIELLQLWCAVRTEDGRRRALECLRRIVDDEQR